MSANMFNSLLLLLFITLKLTHQVDWSWWWVFSPVWIVLVFAVVIGILMLVVGSFDKKMRKCEDRERNS